MERLYGICCCTGILLLQFTFQYGKIILIIILLLNRGERIYIPIWKDYTRREGKHFQDKTLFTFQYGKIILNEELTELTALVHLHSNMERLYEFVTISFRISLLIYIPIWKDYTRSKLIL